MPNQEITNRLQDMIRGEMRSLSTVEEMLLLAVIDLQSEPTNSRYVDNVRHFERRVREQQNRIQALQRLANGTADIPKPQGFVTSPLELFS